MQHVFWLRPDLIAGRPGPVYFPWVAKELAAGGIGAILTLNHGQSVYADELADAGIEHGWFPMEDNAPPRPGDFEHCIVTLPEALAFIDRMHSNGKAVLLHCTAGKDRTGLMMAHYLCYHEKLGPVEAIAEVRRVRPDGLSAPEYEPFAIDVLNALKQDG